MARQKRKLDTTMSNQISLFDIDEQIERMERLESTLREPAIGSQNIDARLRDSLTAAIKSTNCKRYEISGQMSELLGTEITESMLNSWTADSKEGHRFPAAYIPAFCRATGNYAPLKILNEASGCECVESNEVALLIEARMTDNIRQMRKELLDFKKYRDKKTM